MNKFIRLQKEKGKLEREREKLERQKDELAIQEKSLNQEIGVKKSEMSSCYQEFFDKKQNKEFVLYERFPSREMLKAYYKHTFPLVAQGKFNSKELVEAIKQLYSLERQKEYAILTLGLVEKDSTKDYGFTSESLIPHLYFLVGNEKTLAPFKEYDGQFLNDGFLKPTLEDRYKKDFMVIEAERYLRNREEVLPMECLMNSFFVGRKNQINYRNYLKYSRNYIDTVESCTFSKFVQIFRNPLTNNETFDEKYKNCYKKDYYNGIQKVLKYNLTTPDAFIAKVLISICIYKRNNGITELTSDDYNHIFEVLYGEKVDIIGLSESEITRNLTYVPNSKYGI